MKFYKVPGYQVEVTKNGEYIRYLSKKEIKYYLSKDGYKLVSIRISLGNWRTIGVHQLIALTFIGSCPPKHEVNHKDLNKANNYYKNLEYLTHSENLFHASKSGVMLGSNGKTCGESNGASKLTENKVIDIRFLYGIGLYTQKELSKTFKVCQRLISCIVNYKIWKHLEV